MRSRSPAASVNNKEGNGHDDVEARPTVERKRQSKDYFLGTVIFPLSMITLYVCALFYTEHLLCTSEECQMTYMSKRYLFIQNDARTSYRMVKYTDGRDPRYKSLNISSLGSLPLAESCTKNATVVLYIPGHLGDFAQGRSLGAHGVQLSTRANKTLETRSVDALANGSWTSGKYAKSIDTFVYDVYMLDFREEPSGAHGAFLERQSEFIAKSIRFLTQECEPDSIIPIGHSFGGYSLLLAMSRNYDLTHVVKSVFTLSTPHKYPVFAFHRSVADIQREIRSSKMKIVSISGGFRDEMVPPDACESLAENSITLLAPSIMEHIHSDSPRLGMDHRAVVWCYNLLNLLRVFIFEASRSPENVLSRVEHHVGVNSYTEAVQQMKARMKQRFGMGANTIFDIGRLQNIELLFVVYASFMILSQALPGKSIISLVITTVYFYVRSDWECSMATYTFYAIFAYSIVQSLKNLGFSDVSLLLTLAPPLIVGDVLKSMYLREFPGLSVSVLVALFVFRFCFIRVANQRFHRLFSYFRLVLGFCLNLTTRGRAFLVMDFLLAALAFEIAVIGAVTSVGSHACFSPAR